MAEGGQFAWVFHCMQEIKIKPILWRHKIASNGEFEIRIRITQYKEVSYYGTSFTASEVN